MAQRIFGRSAARAEDARGTPTQGHMSPSILLVYEEKWLGKLTCTMKTGTLHSLTLFHSFPLSHCLSLFHSLSLSSGSGARRGTRPAALPPNNRRYLINNRRYLVNYRRYPIKYRRYLSNDRRCPISKRRHPFRSSRHESRDAFRAGPERGEVRVPQLFY